VCINIYIIENNALSKESTHKKKVIGLSWAGVRLIIAMICDVLQNPVSVDTIPTRVET
jgi:hypothetical protein